MDAPRAHGLDPEQRINPNHNQPDPTGHAWLRNIREIRDILADIYMPREGNDRRRPDWSLAGMTVCVVTAFCVCMYDTCHLLSLPDDIATDANSQAIRREAHYRFCRGTACSLVVILATQAIGQMVLRRVP